MSNNATGVLWRRLSYFLSPQLDIYKHLAPKVAGLDVLEVGFGTGFGTVQLASSAGRVTAIETDPSSVAFAKYVFPLRNIRWELGDITTQVRPNYDAVVCLEVLEHIPNWRAALKNMADTGATLYISGPNANANLRKNDIHEREWTAKEFSSSLHEFFSEVKLYRYDLSEELDLDTRATPLLAICRA